jgi:histone H3/H4
MVNGMGKRKRTFAWNPVRRLMKTNGANIVSRDAVELLITDLEKTSQILTQKAITFAKHSKRKKISKEDMLLAIKYI